MSFFSLKVCPLFSTSSGEVESHLVCVWCTASMAASGGRSARDGGDRKLSDAGDGRCRGWVFDRPGHGLPPWRGCSAVGKVTAVKEHVSSDLVEVMAVTTSAVMDFATSDLSEVVVAPDLLGVGRDGEDHGGGGFPFLGGWPLGPEVCKAGGLMKMKVGGWLTATKNP